jgi:hypothetical protein
MAKISAFEIAKPRTHKGEVRFREQAVKRAKDDIIEYADNGDEDAFVQQIKAADPRISPRELLEKIRLFRELKRIRSRGGS